jgi:hypothetical protein
MSIPKCVQHLNAIRSHLRHPLWAHEAAGLDAPQAEAGEAVDELGLDGNVDNPLLVLEAVARADLNDLDHIAPRGGGSMLGAIQTRRQTRRTESRAKHGFVRTSRVDARNYRPGERAGVTSRSSLTRAVHATLCLHLQTLTNSPQSHHERRIRQLGIQGLSRQRLFVFQVPSRDLRAYIFIF